MRFRKKKTITVVLPDGFLLKMRLIPWIPTKKGCVWLASLAVGRSKRQINDWMNRRKKKSVAKLDVSLTGKIGFKTQAIAIRQIRQWVEELSKGESISMRCESAVPEKQFRIWSKWFKKHEPSTWEISIQHKSFFFYK